MKHFAFIAFNNQPLASARAVLLTGLSPSGYYIRRKRTPTAVEQALPVWHVGGAFETFTTLLGRTQAIANLGRLISPTTPWARERLKYTQN